jgi:hypothetical protein
VDKVKSHLVHVVQAGYHLVGRVQRLVFEVHGLELADEALLPVQAHDLPGRVDAIRCRRQGLGGVCGQVT